MRPKNDWMDGLLAGTAFTCFMSGVGHIGTSRGISVAYMSAAVACVFVAKYRDRRDGLR